MKTNITYLKKEVKTSSDGKLTACVIEAMLSLDNNPYLKAIVKDDLQPVKNILSARNAYQLNGNIYFHCNGFARYKETDNNDLTEAKRVAEDKCQLRCLQKAYSIFRALCVVATDCYEKTLYKMCSFKDSMIDMEYHISELTKK